MKNILLIFSILLLSITGCSESGNDASNIMNNDISLESSEAQQSSSSIVESLIPSIDSLYSAIEQKDLDRVQLLIDQGVDINNTDYSKNSPEYPLHKISAVLHAAKLDDINMVKLLIDRGADLNPKLEYNQPDILYWAQKNNNLELFILLADNDAKFELYDSKRLLYSGAFMVAYHKDSLFLPLLKKYISIGKTVAAGTRYMKEIPRGKLTDFEVSNHLGDIPDFELNTFYLDSTEVTVQEFIDIANYDPTIDKSIVESVLCADCPILTVTWFDAVYYANALSKSQGKDTVYTYTGITWNENKSNILILDSLEILNTKGFRLPTTQEWAKAAYAFNEHTQSYVQGFFNGYEWVSDNTSSNVTYPDNTTRPHSVGQLLPNPYGIYDLLGNAREWLNEKFTSYQEDDGQTINCYNNKSKQACVLLTRGAYNYSQSTATNHYISFSYVDNYEYNIGFRMAISE